MKKLLILAFVIVGTITFSQKLKVTSGNFDFLIDQEKINVEFDFSNATFYKENMSEDAYIQKRMTEIRNDKGDEEAKKWREDYDHTKKVTVPHKFLASLNKYGGIKGDLNLKTPYTLIVKTTWVYPGWFAGVMNQPSKVNTLLKFVETNNKNNILLEIECLNAKGDNFVGIPNNNDRIAEAYAKTSKELSQLLNKKVK